MRFPFLIAALALAGAAFFAPAAAEEAQANIVGELVVYCGAHGAIVTLLRKAGGQEKTADGAAVTGGRLEFYRNKFGRWSIVMTVPNTGACLIATGDS
jgi:hypothetical protein